MKMLIICFNTELRSVQFAFTVGVKSAIILYFMIQILCLLTIKENICEYFDDFSE